MSFFVEMSNFQLNLISLLIIIIFAWKSSMWGQISFVLNTMVWILKFSFVNEIDSNSIENVLFRKMIIINS